MDRRKRRPTSYDTFHENLRFNGFRDYTEYLHSDTWRAFNEAYRASKLPQHCLACGGAEFLLHHWTYERVTFEHLSDVIPLCDGCHEKLHRWLIANKNVQLGWVRQQLRQCFGMSRKDADRSFAPFVAMERRLETVKSKPLSRPTSQRRPNQQPPQATPRQRAAALKADKKRGKIQARFICVKCNDNKKVETKRGQPSPDGVCLACRGLPEKQAQPNKRDRSKRVRLVRQVQLDRAAFEKQKETQPSSVAAGQARGESTGTGKQSNGLRKRLGVPAGVVTTNGQR
jgi:hypothetical protein